MGAFEDVSSDDRLIDCGERVVMAGLVDSHVHVNEPGRTEWEGFETATRAAAAGGITTIIDMPLNSIPATVDVPSPGRTTVTPLPAPRRRPGPSARPTPQT